MPTNTSKVRLDDEGYADSFDVVVEQVIGTVSLGRGNTHPYEIAFGIIGKHESDMFSLDMDSSQHSAYHFPGIHEGEVISIKVDHEMAPTAPAEEEQQYK